MTWSLIKSNGMPSKWNMSYGINAFLYSKVVWGRIFPNTQKLVCSPWMRFSRPSTSLGEHMASFCCRKDFTISWKWHGLSSERVLLGGGGGFCLWCVCMAVDLLDVILVRLSLHGGVASSRRHASPPSGFFISLFLHFGISSWPFVSKLTK